MSFEGWRSLARFPAVMFPLASLPRLRARGRVRSPGGAREAQTGLQAPPLRSVPQGAEAENPSMAGVCP